MTTDEQLKRATMQIRKLAKRGTNAKLEELVRGLYTAGIEHGMRAMSNQLKERLNDIQSTDNGSTDGGERRESDSPESVQG